jgi:hypothetical protein
MKCRFIVRKRFQLSTRSLGRYRCSDRLSVEFPVVAEIVVFVTSSRSTLGPTRASFQLISSRRSSSRSVMGTWFQTQGQFPYGFRLP